ncbi:hypothetical protein EYF80_036073 [Liparis tanakae]|uniref:Uncharacterized protein n=1 Tax=Liparis tanakae TaxID=230148 RepID=A0A4Z2GLR7_9TELE|nr:hypothetical protein EYF80_036073 [Liparis tanakae]
MQPEDNSEGRKRQSDAITHSSLFNRAPPHRIGSQPPTTAGFRGPGQRGRRGRGGAGRRKEEEEEVQPRMRKVKSGGEEVGALGRS